MLTTSVRTEVAAELARAELDRVALSPIADRHPDIDVVDAYEIQLLNIQRRLKAGAKVVGHKVGLS
ncbi:2-keto-4-pentenoate hydratase, partial [Nocardia asteroides]